ncbi:DUF1206 domain-containing protein [Leucobacter sp. VD1]|uniref:DUF1206 domain-containing protein n=1 Tax=Leucobacter sp. VD1 TaxID=3080381 RepID=UPI003015D4FC
MKPEVKSAARSAERKTPLRVLARSGYVASGLIHLIIGGIALALAWGGRGEADQAGALTALASAPLGFAALWVVAGLLWALAAYHGVHGVALRIEQRPKRWARRSAEWGQAALFLVMGVLAAAVAVGARPDPDSSAREASRGLLTVPGGPVLLGLIGAGVAIGGVSWIVMGVRRSFRKRVALPPGLFGRVVAGIGVLGFVMKGVALTAVGVLLVEAAVQRDPQAAGGFDAAIESLRGLPFGGALVAVMGTGFVAYGVFCVFRARYAKL